MDKKEIEMLRETFKTNYAKLKGWDPNNLTTEQFMEITKQKEWKSPGLILS